MNAKINDKIILKGMPNGPSYNNLAEWEAKTANQRGAILEGIKTDIKEIRCGQCNKKIADITNVSFEMSAKCPRCKSMNTIVNTSGEDESLEPQLNGVLRRGFK